MTVVAVKKYNDRIEISADQQTTVSSSYKMTVTKEKIIENSGKIFRSGDITVASAGFVREVCMMQIYLKDHTIVHPSHETILNFMVEFCDWCKKNESKFELSNDYILVTKGEVFRIRQGYQIEEVKEYTAIGSGMFLALGALYFNKTPEQAVEVAKEFDLFCGGKTQSLTIKI